MTDKDQVQEVEVSSEVVPSADVEEKASKPKKPKKRARWYVVQARSNYEKRVQAAIKEQAIMTGLDDKIEDVIIPVEQVVEVKKGQKVKSERKFYPGYVLVKAQMTDEVWILIKGTTHVIGFVGAESGRKPLPISNSEAERMLKQMEDGVEKEKPVMDIEVGQEIRVLDGPFATFQGLVEEVDGVNSKLKVSVSIFGRTTPIELDYVQVEKL
ncbi:MAG: transcription termination/antitermination protein NusG [Magnetococcales bacterium]|nr:transcription termination/antitermination protein NusG [Magnetococcales bacterium]|tara:strand:- start:326 stop:961 length:636 start_codon:yes stop_codon:yes gene_type:complete